MEVAFFPNPFSQNIKINAAFPIKEIQMFDLNGASLSPKMDLQSSGVIDLHTNRLPSGTYFIHVILGDDQKKVFKVVKQ